MLAGKGRRQSGFDLAPRQSTCEHHQGMSEINHLIESGAEKIVGSHQNFPQFLSGFYGQYFNFSGISWGGFLAEIACSFAFRVFCRADQIDARRLLLGWLCLGR